MNVMSISRVAILAALAAVLLTGCGSAGTSEPNESAPTQSTPTRIPVSEGDPGFEESLSERMKDEVGVEILEVQSPRVFLIGPDAWEKDYYDLSGEETVELRDDMVTPEKGECGYDEALSFARDYFAADAEADVSGGVLYAPAFDEDYIRAGFAYIPDVTTSLRHAQEEAQYDKNGLWGTCDSFGA